MSKPLAFVTHLLLSVAVVGGLLLLLIARWYPIPYFLIDGGWQGIRLVAAVDVVLGPLITLVIYNRNKSRGKLIFDYSVIGAIQACAFAFGVWTVFSTRTTVVVFADGVFYTLGADTARFLHDPYPAILAHAPGTPAYAVVTMPAEEEARQKLRRESLAMHRPLFSYLERVGPLTRESFQQLVENQLDLPDLLARQPESRPEVERFLEKHGGTVQEYVFVPVKPRYRQVVLAFARDTGRLAGWLDITLPSKIVVKRGAGAMTASPSDS
jgi:hypothetical protein